MLFWNILLNYLTTVGIFIIKQAKSLYFCIMTVQAYVQLEWLRHVCWNDNVMFPSTRIVTSRLSISGMIRNYAEHLVFLDNVWCCCNTPSLPCNHKQSTTHVSLSGYIVDNSSKIWNRNMLWFTFNLKRKKFKVSFRLLSWH